jgi:hypothetical protein
MSDRTIVQEFLYHLDPEEVPLEYISAAAIRDTEGREVVLRGQELQMLMSNHPDYRHVRDCRVFIDLKRVIAAVNLEVEFIHEQVNAMMDWEETNGSPL